MRDLGRADAAVLSTVLMTAACSLVFGLALERPNAPDPVARHPLPAKFRKVSASITCGAVPQSVNEILALREAGMRTIVSVDGMQPDVASATAAGLPYVHIPIGYDGIPQDDIARLVRVLKDCESPVYVHCHHGRHRGPAAAAVCALIAHELSVEQAIQLLTDAGTSDDYAGLWRDVRNFRPLPPDYILPTISSSVELEPLAASMVKIDECWEKLNHAVESSAPQQALEQAAVLEQLFRESSRLKGVDAACPWLPDMTAAESAIRALKENLRHHPETVGAAVNAVSASCRDCHVKHRN